MSELELLIDLHRGTDRQGPGKDSDTERALGFLDLPTDQRLNVADIGCGTGGPTLVLARQLNADITAIDLFPEFLSELEARAITTGLSHAIRTCAASMDDLPFEPGSFDLIWSEGAIYNIGFERGIHLWRDLLKPGGFLAVSEITWLTSKRPAEIHQYWTSEYPSIGTASTNIRLLEDAGFILTGYFPLPPTSWKDTYYSSLAAGFDAFLERNNHSDAARIILTQASAEMDLYEKYHTYYSYGFYIARKL